jgi:hypothetical protein
MELSEILERDNAVIIGNNPFREVSYYYLSTSQIIVQSITKLETENMTERDVDRPTS